MASIDPTIFEELKDLLEDELAEVLDMFINDSREQVATLKSSVEDSDLAAIITTVHTLKSSSANLGALELAELCEKMETDGRENKLKNPDILLSEIIAERTRVEEELSKHL